MKVSRLSTRNCEKICEKKNTPPFPFDHLFTQVPKSSYFMHGSESAKYSQTFFGIWLQRSSLSQKRLPIFTNYILFPRSMAINSKINIVAALAKDNETWEQNTNCLDKQNINLITEK